MNTKALRQKILDLAIHGKLVPQDPNDEPASVLLERIKAEKERLIKEGKIKRSKQSKTACDKHYENIPNGWSWIKLGDVTEILSSKRVHKSDYVTNGIPFYRTTEIKELSEGIKPTNSLYISKEQYQNIKDKFGVPQLGDILISAVGTIGITYVVEDNNPFYFKDGNLIWIKRCKAFIPTFLRLLLTYMVKELRIISTSGSAYNALTIEKLLDLNILIPPLKEQRRIIDKIEYWFTSIERIERDKIELQTTLKQAKSKILDLAIHGKLVPQDPTDEPACELLKRINPKAEITCDNPQYGKQPFDIPQTWSWVKLGDIASSNIGLTYRPTDITLDGIPVYRSNNIKNGVIDTSDIVRVNTKILNKQFLNEGDLLICARNGSRNLVGKNAIIEKLIEPTSFGAFMAVCRSEYNHWIRILLNTEYFDRYLDNSNSATINQLTQNMLLSFHIPFPPLNEQHRIVAKIEELFAQLDNIASSL